jgi:hypothetical protein
VSFAGWLKRLAVPRSETSHWDDELRSLLAGTEQPRDAAGRFTAAAEAVPDGDGWGALVIEAAAAVGKLSAEVAEIKEGRAGGRALAREAGWTDEGLKSLEEWMEQKGVADHEIAIPAFERENPPAEPIASGSSHRAWLAQPQRAADPAAELKVLFDGDENAFLHRSIESALREIRSVR